MTAPWAASGRLTARGASLDYACWGPAPHDAPTLVLLHEGLGCVALWRDVPDRLSEATGWGVFAYSRAGYGQSDPVQLPRPLDYMTRAAVEVLPEVLDAVGVQRCVLVGHSDGATIAAIHAGTVIDRRVRGVVLIAPHFFTEDMGLAAIAAAKTNFDTGDLAARLAKYHAHPDIAFHGWNDAWLHPDFRTWTVSDVIDDIRVPVLAIQGVQDQYGTLAQLDELGRRCNAPVDLVVLDPCGHTPQFDQHDRVTDEISDYCVRLERIEAARSEMA